MKRSNKKNISLSLYWYKFYGIASYRALLIPYSLGWCIRIYACIRPGCICIRELLAKQAKRAKRSET